MNHWKGWLRWLALLAGGFPLVTFATCDRTGRASGNFYLVSSNDNLVDDVLDFMFGDHDDDDDDDD